MIRRFLGGVSLGLLSLILLPAPLWAQPSGSDQASSDNKSADAKLDAKAMAKRIDALIAAGWKANKVKPASRTTDAEYVRRLYLDMGGRIPSILEVRDFLDDDRADKRALWMDKLLDGEMYSRHFANFWRDLLVAQSNNQQLQFFVPQMEGWLRSRLKENAPYDQMVREILTTPQPFNQGGGFQGGGQGQGNPSAFYQANEFKPENLASSASRIFLGVKLECAQCHKHPFAKWTKNQFWEFAAFFSEIQPNRGLVQGSREIKIPNTDKVAKAKFLNGGEPQFKQGQSARITLADWITAADNPYFAKAVVNRMWAYFMGFGIIDPVDDEPDADNPPVHTQILDELSKQFVANRYDLKWLIRAIASSEAYQLSSVGTGDSKEDTRLFTRMAVRGLSPEQIFDSVAEATEYQDPNPNSQQPQFNPNFMASPRQEFIAKFASQDKRTETHTSILQALYMMNGKFMSDQTGLDRNKTLTTIADAVSSSTERRIETLYLVVLSRPPRADEMQRLVKYVNSGGARKDPRKALTDVYWALLNSAEFMLNH